MSNDKDTFIGRFNSEIEQASILRRKRPIRFILLILVLVLLGAWWIYDHFWGIPALKSTISTQQVQINSQRQEITLLETQLAPVKTAAILKYGNADVEALARLAEDVRKYTFEVRRIENKIRVLAAEIEVEFSSKWKNGLPPDPTQWFRVAGNGRPEVTATFITKDGRHLRISCGHSDGIKIVPLTNGFVRLSYRIDALPGSEVFGEQPDDIKEISEFQFACYGLGKSFSEGDRADVRSVKIRFYINGAPRLFAEAIFSEQVILDEQNQSLIFQKTLPIRQLVP